MPDPSLSIRDGAVAAWPGAWLGKNFRDILRTLGYDVDRPWRDLDRADRDWILFTDEHPVVTVNFEREAGRIQRPYQGRWVGVREYVLETFATTKSAPIRRRLRGYLDASPCPVCGGGRLRPEALAVTFAGHDIADLAALPLERLVALLREAATEHDPDSAAGTLLSDLLGRSELVVDLGLGYLSLDRAVPTLSAGELQRLRLATQLRSGLFGVVYVLDEPSAGLHPADTEALQAGAARAARRRQQRAPGRARPRPGPFRGLAGRRRPGRRQRRRPGAAQRAGRRAAGRRGLGHPALPRRGPPAGRTGGPADPDRLAASARGDGPQPARDGPLAPAGHVHGRHRGLRGRQVDAGRGAGRRHPAPSRAARLPRRGGGGRRPGGERRAGRRRPRGRYGRRGRGRRPTGDPRGRARRGPPAGAGGPAADRADAALQPRDLHRPVRRGALDVRQDAGGEAAPLERQPVLLQRRRGPLPHLQGRGVPGRPDAVPARLLLASAPPATGPATPRRRSR